MMTNFDGLDDLMRQRPEWAPWLSVIGTALDEIGHPHWDAAVVRDNAAPARAAPLLAHCTLELHKPAVQRLFESLMRTAARDGTATMARLRATVDGEVDPLLVMQAALNREQERLTQYAFAVDADADAFSAVTVLMRMPILHACRRHYASAVHQAWSRGYCPVCGGWPAFAEVRGVDRSRHFRCGDCGGEWHTSYLACPFCGTTDHERLGSLVPEAERGNAVMAVCNACLGCVKVFTTLRAAPSSRVVLHDLATAELDIAAAERGYARPRTVAYALDLKVIEHAT